MSDLEILALALGSFIILGFALLIILVVCDKEE
jgi:hypothetical protein